MITKCKVKHLKRRTREKRQNSYGGTSAQFDDNTIYMKKCERDVRASQLFFVYFRALPGIFGLTQYISKHIEQRKKKERYYIRLEV